MSEVLEKLQLAIRPLREDGGAEGLHDLLDGNILVRELITGGADESESTHAHWLQVRVPRGDLECGTEDLGSDEFGHVDGFALRGDVR